ncbi:FRIGIDA-like protein 4a [Spinacia oleracea]|uniref:FRIGIDA-like protein n=1 Tax=Spinacia oleracea TaxID=3562 RepID=A0A9R0HR68_SPIOL|nr:FRIGIDA-like protein 4a [Spinacia oleracea]
MSKELWSWRYLSKNNVKGGGGEEVRVEERELEVENREKEVEDRQLTVDKRKLKVEEREIGVEMREKEVEDRQLALAPDPAKFALDVIQSFYELLESESVSRQTYSRSCIVLSVALLENATVTQRLKDDAMKFSITWRGLSAKRGYTHFMEIYSFLLFLASYKLGELYDKDQLLSLLGTLYIETEVRLPGQDYLWCQMLGSRKEIPGHIQSLIKREEHITAVAFICIFRMEDTFPPVPLLKACLEGIQKRACEMVKQGSDATAQNDAVNMELSSLKGVLKCISKFKLESSLSPTPLELRVKQLEKEKERNTDAESTLSTAEDNLSNSEKKGVSLPGIDHSHLVIRNKHALNSMESKNKGKRLKVDANCGESYK